MEKERNVGLGLKRAKGLGDEGPMWPPDPAARWRQSSWKDPLGWHRRFATEEGTSADTKKGSSEREQAIVCFARSKSGVDMAKAAWRRREKLPSHSLGFHFPGLQLLVLGEFCVKSPEKGLTPLATQRPVRCFSAATFPGFQPGSGRF